MAYDAPGCRLFFEPPRPAPRRDTLSTKSSR